MKSDVMDSIVLDGPIVQMKPAILKQLVTEVKETKPSFGLVDMWNIRKHGRYAGKPRQKGTITTGISY